MPKEPHLIGWWCRSTSLKVAATRIRAAHVMRGLEAGGLEAEWFDARKSSRYRCVVLSSRQDNATIAAIRRLQSEGCRVVLDFCDNKFMPASDSAKQRKKTDNLLALTTSADAIVAATDALARTIAEHCPDAPPAMVIGDLADDLSVIPVPWHRRPNVLFKRRIEAARLSMVAGDGVARLVWFGHHGGRQPQSGLVDLARLCGLLQSLHRERPLHLTVISNNRARYAELIAGHGFPSHYVEWDPWTFEERLRSQHIALIPATPNAFTHCKSDNRVVTAFRAGLAVVASSVPSCRAFRGSLILDDFEEGLRTYISDPERRQTDVALGRILAARTSAPGPILSRWREVLLGAALDALPHSSSLPPAKARFSNRRSEGGAW